MNCSRFAWIFLLALGLIAVNNSYAQTGSAEEHVEAAKEAATPNFANPQPWDNFQRLFRQSCSARTNSAPPALGRSAPLEPVEAAKLIPAPREEWYVPPAKVFDNLYFIGTKTNSTWALTTSEGIILINTNFDWVIQDLVQELTIFGLKPSDIKYVIVVRSHSDQSWGINALKAIVPSAHVIMSEIDWNLLETDNSPAKVKPQKDMVAVDGESVTLGDTTVKLYSTPGSSPGNLSITFPVKDGNTTHMAGMVGGTTMNLVQGGIQVFPHTTTMIQTFIASAKRFKSIEDKAGVDTIISIHPTLDDMFDKVRALRLRNPSNPNPFVSKGDVDRFSTILIDCAEARLARTDAQ